MWSPRRVGLYCVAVETLLLCCVCAESLAVTKFLAVEDTHKMKQTANGECLSRGGYLAMDSTDSMHLKIVESIRLVATSEYYYAFLGGSMGPSRKNGCPESYERRPSINCTWYWNEGVYENENLRFYRGNLHPNTNMNGFGLFGAGRFPGVPTYWYTLNEEQIHPAEQFLYSIMLVSTREVKDQWVDNSDGPGFQYQKAQGSFYAACVFFPDVQPPDPGDSRDGQSNVDEGEQNASVGKTVLMVVLFVAIAIAAIVLLTCICCRNKAMDFLCCRQRDDLDDSVDDDLRDDSVDVHQRSNLSGRCGSSNSLYSTRSDRDLARTCRSQSLLSTNDRKSSFLDRSSSTGSLTADKRKGSRRQLFWDSDSN